uniref:Uncharacterized protein n=1 Tax=Oryza barthii TaxID=65489 RepID=A0A0D3G692_9ORYZ
MPLERQPRRMLPQLGASMIPLINGSVLPVGNLPVPSNYGVLFILLIDDILIHFAENKAALILDHPMGQVTEVNVDERLALVPIVDNNTQIQQPAHEPRVENFLKALEVLARNENPRHPYFYPMTGRNDRIEKLCKAKDFMALSCKLAGFQLLLSKSLTTLVLPKKSIFDSTPSVVQKNDVWVLWPIEYVSSPQEGS